jgi:hypothetical protein
LSLWRHRRAIERAIVGDLSPAAERNLRLHLDRCPDCRGHYDRLARVAEALAPGMAQRRERLRLQAAVAGGTDATTVPSPPPIPSLGWLRWLRWSPLVLAPAALLLFALRSVLAPSLNDPDHNAANLPLGEVTWRGSDAGANPELGVLVYASPRARAGAQAVRLVADLPHSGEGTLSLDEYVQFRVHGLREAAFVTVVGLDDAGDVHVYAPRDKSALRPLPADPAPRTVGPSVDLSVKHRPGRLRLFAIATATPGNPETIAAAVRRAGFADPLDLPGKHVSGLLAITR